MVYAAERGEVNLEIAKMELNNFKKVSISRITKKMDPYEHYTYILWCTIIIVDTKIIQNVNSSISHKNSVFMSFRLYGNLRKFLRGCLIFLLLDSLILLQS